MKKIKYNGSVANDVEFLQNGSKTTKRLVITSAVTAVGALGLLPLVGGVVSAVALGTSIVSLVSAGVSYYKNGKKAEEAEERLYTLLDAMKVDEEVNEKDIRIFETDMSVQNLKKFETRRGKYIIIRDGKKQHIIREHEGISQDYAEYQQFLVDYEAEIERQLVLDELSTAHDIVILKK